MKSLVEPRKQKTKAFRNPAYILLCMFAPNIYHAGHIIKDAERLLAPMQKITDYLLNSFANDIQCLSMDDK